ncbi:DUF4351 domain-containing protein [Sodalinema gerasimenkoae]|uniref:DUF4351 domain-containing protein n=1 Tax=Sodalinema gerasimenkoae TaxID=2862348 RepID=UPI0013574904|nr:DUF4351 domain-containing protein [Sodalinema gerasimenkoae]
MTQEPKTDYDSPWKQLLEADFQQFMEFFFPRAAAQIDWEQPVTFLDKELQQVVRDADLGKRLADKLVQVSLRTGDEVWVLIHVEVQNQPESNFAERMFCYYYRIRDRYSRQVASFAVLGDDQPSWRPQQFTDELFDCQVDFRFPIVKLLDYQTQWDQLEASDNVFAIVVMAHLKTLETRHNGRERQRWKFALIRGLYQRGFEAEEVISLLHFIDWLMNLPEELNQQLWQQVSLLEEEQRMQYMTSFERRARQEGLEQGVRLGKVELVRQLLSERLGSLDAEMLSRLDQLSSSQLDALARQLFQFQSLNDLDGWLDSLDS